MAVDIEPEMAIGRLHRQEEKIIEESGLPYSRLQDESQYPSSSSSKTTHKPSGDAVIFQR
ncbi:MAG TPA: hypothetical protein VFH04_01925 [Nitrososphaeraceae archaeon]|nr:hypothetical protein [Nitrososphaeraceae archaeon]